MPSPSDEQCNNFKTIGKLTFASLYNYAARRVAINEVERLTTMTEQQLRALAKINELIVKRVKERNDVRAKLKALE
jgi:predicted transglutaminase-like cysteine proteinase